MRSRLGRPGWTQHERLGKLPFRRDFLLVGGGATNARDATLVYGVGLFLRIQSKTANPEGLIVRVSPPSKGRYSEGAPVAVHMVSAVRA